MVSYQMRLNAKQSKSGQFTTSGGPDQVFNLGYKPKLIYFEQAGVIPFATILATDRNGFGLITYLLQPAAGSLPQNNRAVVLLTGSVVFTDGGFIIKTAFPNASWHYTAIP